MGNINSMSSVGNSKNCRLDSPAKWKEAHLVTEWQVVVVRGGLGCVEEVPLQPPQQQEGGGKEGEGDGAWGGCSIPTLCCPHPSQGDTRYSSKPISWIKNCDISFLILSWTFITPWAGPQKQRVQDQVKDLSSPGAPRLARVLKLEVKMLKGWMILFFRECLTLSSWNESDWFSEVLSLEIFIATCKCVVILHHIWNRGPAVSHH